MDYFEWFGIDRKYNIDQGALRKAFLVKSMELHPDKAGDQNDAGTDMSGYNNLAYAALKDEKSRLTYILQLEGILIKDEKPQLPQQFLMEMLDLNMEIEDAKDNKDTDKIDKIKAKLNLEQENKLEEVKELLAMYDAGTLTDEGKAQLKNYYFIRKYLLRIEESIYTFASH